MNRNDNQEKMKKKEEGLNQLKEKYADESFSYNKTCSPLFQASMQLQRLKQAMEQDGSDKHKQKIAAKIKELETALTASENAVKEMLKKLEEKMQEIWKLEQELYGQKASQKGSPSILEKKHMYSKD